MYVIVRLTIHFYLFKVSKRGTKLLLKEPEGSRPYMMTTARRVTKDGGPDGASRAKV